MMEPRWDDKNKRWEASIGSGANRRWFRSKIEGEPGRIATIAKRDRFLQGPGELTPGTLAEFIEAVWWPVITADCTFATQQSYITNLKTWVSPLYDYHVADLRLEVLQPWISRIAATPCERRNKSGEVIKSWPRSEKTTANIWGLMQGILELAHKTGRYPHHDHKLVRIQAYTPPSKDELSAERVRKILAAAEGTAMEPAIWVASHLGLRLNEVLGLKRHLVTIEEDHAVLTVAFNRQRHGETQKLKSKKKGVAHVLRIPKAWGEKLLSFGHPDQIYLILGPEGKPMDPGHPQTVMPALCKTAGVPKTKFHELRAACRTNLEAAGAPLLMIMAILNHSSVKSSATYHSRLSAEEIALLDVAGRRIEGADI